MRKHKLHSLLATVIQPKANKRTRRKIIIFKDQKSYHQCVHFFKKKGITPIKKVKSANMVCCHVHPKNTLKSITKHPGVRLLESDCSVKTHGFTPGAANKSRTRRTNIPWGIKRIQAPEVWPRSLGAGTRVAIIDTGVGPNPDIIVAGGINTIDPKESFQDNNGHGTNVAGIAAARGKGRMISGAAPRAKIYAVKALDQDGNGFVSDIIEGVEWCIKNRMRVINMSLGLNGKSQALRESVRRAYRNGIIIVASAGNSGTQLGRIDEPGSYPETIAVAASNRRNRIAPFSSRGKGIALTAPGVDILSLGVPKGTVVDSGTSMAAPHVSGSAALLLRLKPALSPRNVRKLLTSTARKLPGFTKRSQGCGLVQVFAAANKIPKKIKG